MSQVQKVAFRLESKLAMLVDAFNYLLFEVNEQKKALKAIKSSPTGGSHVVDQLEQAGINVTL